MNITTALVATWLAGTSWNGTWHEPGAIPPTKYIQAPPIARTSIAPPPEFDYPFPGKLYISAENTFEQMMIGCGFNPALGIRWLYGCAVVPGMGRPGVGYMYVRVPGDPHNECMILLLKRELVEQYYDYEELIRHERAHCLGWRHDIVVAEKPAWPRVIDKVADNPTEKPSVEKKPAEKRTAERPARQPMPSGRESINWPLAVVSTILSTPFYIVATLTGRLR
jgi:hypothetical protein